MSKENYQATDDDLPAQLWEQPRQPNRVMEARDRIRTVARDMGFTLDTEQLDIFAILLVGLGE